ncbi:MAG: HisA/HisF-related TIM barrel protein [Pirellulales bacterium]
MADQFPKQLVLGIDARDGYVATHGWLETSKVSAVELAQKIQSLTSNVPAIVYTDIARDGMLSGPNFAQLQQMQESVSIPIIASGGVTSLDDIDRLVEMKTHAAIVGRALYEGRLDLAETLRRARREVAAGPP